MHIHIKYAIGLVTLAVGTYFFKAQIREAVRTSHVRDQTLLHD